MRTQNPHVSSFCGMRLKEIFADLERESLHEPLMKWFRTAYSESVDSKIVSLHFACEVRLGCWRHPRFGYMLSKEFSSFLKNRGQDYKKSAEIAKEFCNSSRKFRFFGMRSKPSGRVAHVVRLKHLLQALGAEGKIDDRSTDIDFVCTEVENLLKEKKISIGHEGIAWFAQINKEVDKELKDAIDTRTACDLLGKNFVKNHPYVVLSVRHKNYLRRPTVYDGEFKTRFHPDCKEIGWGQTLRSCSLKAGPLESVMKKSKHHAKLEKYLLPSNDDVSSPDDELKEEYFELERKRFKARDEIAYQDLENAWTSDERWW